MTTPAIAVIGLNLSSGLERFIRASHGLATDVVLFHEGFQGRADSVSLADRYQRRAALADTAVEVSPIEPVRVLSALESLADRYEIRGVYAGGERYVEVAARVAAVYDLPGPGLGAASISRNKLMQRLLCRRHGLPVPAFTTVSSADEAHGWVSHAAPVVVKPCTGWGSAGVRRLDSPAALDIYLAEAYHPQRDGFPLLLEEYLAGREVSVECLVLDGQPMVTSITHKGKGSEPHFVETLQAVPAELSDGLRTSYRDLATRIIGLTRMETGILHLEAISHSESNEVYPVEWAVREPGHAIMDLIDWRFGQCAMEYLVALHLGIPPAEPPVEDPHRIALTVFIELPPGTVLRVRRDRDPATIPGLVDFDFYAAEGDIIEPARDNWGTQGAYSVFAKDLTDLCRVLDHLDEAFAVLVRTEEGQETWIQASSQARAQVLDHPAPTRARS